MVATASPPPHRPPPSLRHQDSFQSKRYQDSFQVNLALSLLSCFDFAGVGEITHSDWLRGTRLLALGDIGADDELWARVLRTYGAHTEADKPRGFAGVVHTEDIDEAPPMAANPLLIGHVVKALIHKLADVADVVDSLRSRASSQNEVRKSGAFLAARRATLAPALGAWREVTRQQRALRRLAARRAIAPGLARMWRHWTERAALVASARKYAVLVATFAQRQRREALSRGLSALGLWRDAVFARRASRRLYDRRCARLRALRALRHWAARASARAGAEAPASPVEVKAVSTDPPPARVAVTGWHTDLSIYGTNVRHRDDVILKMEAMARQEKVRGEALQPQPSS